MYVSSVNIWEYYENHKALWFKLKRDKTLCVCVCVF